MLDSYMKGAVEEYIENNRAVLEDMCEQGVFSPADVEEQLESIRANIEKNIKSNKAYAMLMIEMDRGKAKTKYNNNFVSLTEIAKLKNFKNPSYVIQSWLRDRNTLEFLFQWELENNVAFDIQGHREVEKKLSDPSFTLTLKIWKGYARRHNRYAFCKKHEQCRRALSCRCSYGAVPRSCRRAGQLLERGIKA